MTEGRKKKIESMTWEKAIETLHRMARIYIAHTNWGWNMERHMWDLVGDWNDLHENEGEIFMCEYSLDENGNETGHVTGFMIEDDYYLYRY